MIELTPEVMQRFLQAATASTELWEVAEKHAIIETDPVTNAQQVTGPFADAYRAVVAAQAMLDRAPSLHDKPYPTYRVVQYFTPEQSGLTPDGDTTHFMLPAGRGEMRRVMCIYCKDTAEALGEDADNQPCPVGNAR